MPISNVSLGLRLLLKVGGLFATKWNNVSEIPWIALRELLSIYLVTLSGSQKMSEGLYHKRLSYFFIPPSLYY